MNHLSFAQFAVAICLNWGHLLVFVKTFCSAVKFEKEITLFIGVKHNIELLFLGQKMIVSWYFQERYSSV